MRDCTALSIIVFFFFPFHSRPLTSLGHSSTNTSLPELTISWWTCRVTDTTRLLLLDARPGLYSFGDPWRHKGTCAKVSAARLSVRRTLAASFVGGHERAGPPLSLSLRDPHSTRNQHSDLEKNLWAFPPFFFFSFFLFISGMTDSYSWMKWTEFPHELLSHSWFLPSLQRTKKRKFYAYEGASKLFQR